MTEAAPILIEKTDDVSGHPEWKVEVFDSAIRVLERREIGWGEVATVTPYFAAPSRNMARAQLIAAAPALLEALKAIEKYVLETKYPSPSTVAEVARAAIAQAQQVTHD